MYTIESEQGQELSTGIQTLVEARASARRHALNMGETVTLYGPGLRHGKEEIAPQEDDSDIRAFENVLAPRFTRDEAIAIVKSAAYAQAESHWLARGTVEGIRLALEALAAARAFAPAEHVCGLQGFGALGDTCPACGTMADKLDAAEIR